VEAIVLAAGEGLRMRPLTERWPKPVLPIDGRPVLSTLLREFAASGIGPTTVVVGHLADAVERLIRGLDVRVARQAEPLGSADAVSAGLAAGVSPPLLVSAADTVFTSGDVGAFAKRFAASEAVAAVAFRPRPARRKQGVRIQDGRVVEIPSGAKEAVWAAPLWGLRDELLSYLSGLPGPPFELGDACQRAIDAGLQVAAFEIGLTRDLTHPLDLVEENFPYLAGL
jgi:UDP-N-acetylglucosamine diphosphorylase / glucose-1-phosphate thymidylyltransferase / UDP-N-acetylgalactosamine diphosphorylase / glucosamine-1-phosphate N-acetyltransferase / galactosamine-1-phosphate N-acetyltransferase